jgi:hypothetical protein
VRSFAGELRGAGHTVHTPDMFDGRTFATIEEGMAFARESGFGALAERGVAAAGELPKPSTPVSRSGSCPPSSSRRRGPARAAPS